MREFVIRNQNRLLWGSDQVSGDGRGWDFLASRWWCHRKLWETAYDATSPIFDPDLPEDRTAEAERPRAARQRACRSSTATTPWRS